MYSLKAIGLMKTIVSASITTPSSASGTNVAYTRSHWSLQTQWRERRCLKQDQLRHFMARTGGVSMTSDRRSRSVKEVLSSSRSSYLFRW